MSMEVSRKIHSNDHLFSFIKSDPNLSSEDKAVNYYLETGLESANRLKEIINEFSYNESCSILEFASGYGCVSRHFKSVLPNAQVTPCDIHSAAIDFLCEIGLRPILSRSNPEDLEFGQAFDVAFVLSFFSHVPKKRWRQWLYTLCKAVVPGGLVIFTTHGFASTPTHPVDTDGFYFSPGSEQIDIDAFDYGTTVTTFDYVHHQIRSIPEVRLVKFREGLWWGHQDLYVLRKLLDA